MNNLNKNIDAFFIDLDGTSFDIRNEEGRHWVSDANLDAIKAARKDGKHVIISTGRTGVNLNKYFELIGGDYVLAGNGAQIINKKGKVIVEHKLTVQQVLKVLEVLQRNKMVLKVDDDWFGYGAFSKMQKAISKKFGFKPIEGYHFEMHKPRIKIVTWGKLSKGAIEKVREDLIKSVDGISAVTSAHGYTIEITAVEATKGKAAKYACQELLGVDPKRAAHIGDSMNDSTVVGQIGRLIAMGNADKELKKLTKYVGPKAKHQGLAYILQGQYKEIEPKK